LYFVGLSWSPELIVVQRHNDIGIRASQVGAALSIGSDSRAGQDSANPTSGTASLDASAAA
jgi:hypothetical protein